MSLLDQIQSVFRKKQGKPGKPLDLSRITVSTDGGRARFFQVYEERADSQTEATFRELTEDELRTLSPDELGDLLALNDPNVSKIIDDVFTLGTISFEASCADARGQMIIDDALRLMEDKGTPFSSFLTRCFVSVMLRGNLFCEVVLDENLNFSNLICIDPKYAYFRKQNDQVDGEIWVLGQYINGKWTAIESDTVYFEAINPLLGKPKGTSLISTIFPSVISQTLMSQDLRRVIHNHAWPQRFIAIDIIKMKQAGFDDEAINEMVAHSRRMIQENWSQLSPEDTPVGTGDIEMREYTGATSGRGLSFVDQMDRIYDRKLIRGGKTTPFNMGSNEYVAESSARSQAIIYAERIGSYQDNIERMIRHFLTLAVRAKGVSADVVFTLKRLNAAQRRDEAEMFQIVMSGMSSLASGGVPFDVVVEMYEDLAGYQFPEELKEKLADVEFVAPYSGLPATGDETEEAPTEDVTRAEEEAKRGGR